MYLLAIGWMYVVAMMAAAEIASPNGSWLGALVTLLLYGLLPVSILLYILGAPIRAKARRAREREEQQAPSSGAALQPDPGNHAAGHAVTPIGKEP
jgi:uncharacterized membrane protein